MFAIDTEGMKGEIEHTSIKEIRNQLIDIFNCVMNLIKLVGEWISKIFYLSMIFLIVDATKYEREYYTDDDFDNMMVRKFGSMPIPNPDSGSCLSPLNFFYLKLDKKKVVGGAIFYPERYFCTE